MRLSTIVDKLWITLGFVYKNRDFMCIKCRK